MPAPDATVTDGDSDGDWLCDSTERGIGTDPLVVDSDGDRLPDGLELHYGLSPLDEAEPGAPQIAVLRAQPGSVTDLELHVVVDGAGEAFSGELAAWQPLDVTWPSADNYFAIAQATSADPPDHVFGFPNNGDRIESVVGQTRLGFRLRFVFTESEPRDCAQAVPFNYAIKRQDGVRFGDRNYILLITPDAEDITWCAARSCL